MRINRSGPGTDPAVRTARKGYRRQTGYCPNFVRRMWNVDILVHPADYDRALQIAQEQGCRGKWAPHSIDLKRGNMEAIDLFA